MSFVLVSGTAVDVLVVSATGLSFTSKALTVSAFTGSRPISMTGLSSVSVITGISSVISGVCTISVSTGTGMPDSSEASVTMSAISVLSSFTRVSAFSSVMRLTMSPSPTTSDTRSEILSVFNKSAAVIPRFARISVSSSTLIPSFLAASFNILSLSSDTTFSFSVSFTSLWLLNESFLSVLSFESVSLFDVSLFTSVEVSAALSSEVFAGSVAS